MTRFHNQTRRSASIPARLIREGKLHLLPVYYLGRLSWTGREAIERGGSYGLADHIYAGRPAGATPIGRLIDSMFLRLPSARSFRMRYRSARAELDRLVDERLLAGRDARALAIPCGLARELFDVAERFEPDLAGARRVRLEGVDLDSALVDRLREQARGRCVVIDFRCADALTADAFGSGGYDAIVSLGFTEFLGDDDALRFYRLACAALAPGGVLITSGLSRHALSDYLLRNVAELFTAYRGERELAGLALAAGFASTRTYSDPTGLLTMLVAARS